MMLSEKSATFRDHALNVAPEVGAVALQLPLQHVDGNMCRALVSGKRKAGSGSGRLAHGETGPAHPRGGLSEMRHRGAAAGNEEMVAADRQQHAVRQMIE